MRPSALVRATARSVALPGSTLAPVPPVTQHEPRDQPRNLHVPPSPADHRKIPSRQRSERLRLGITTFSKRKLGRRKADNRRVLGSMRDPVVQSRCTAGRQQLVHGRRKKNGNQLLLVEPLHQLERSVPEFMRNEHSGCSLHDLGCRLVTVSFKLSLKKGSEQRMHAQAARHGVQSGTRCPHPRRQRAQLRRAGSCSARDAAHPCRRERAHTVRDSRADRSDDRSRRRRSR